jgi:hypothetical protein
MRRRTSSIFLLTLTLVVCVAAKDESLPELKSRFEKVRIEDRPDLAVKIAQLELRQADRFYVDGKVEEARAAVANIVVYCEKAGEAASQTKKHLKNVEIDVRKMAERLRDIKRTLAFEDQPPVELAAHRLEDIRTRLLQEMFAKEDKKDKN